MNAEMPSDKNHLGSCKVIRLAAPRGFCAGVDRAVRIVEVALEKYGTPVYVRHEIVHNKYVVDSLAAKGAIFVKELDEIPEGAPVVFSAHGVPKAVLAEAERRDMIAVDATCPLVTKVHVEAHRHTREGCHIFLIGHEGHPEVEGTMGQVPVGTMTLIETAEDAHNAIAPDGMDIAFASQTTLSVDDTAEIVAILRRRFPHIKGPRGEDICYATTNRQNAVKTIADKADLVLIIGAENSSNSKRLVEVALRGGAKQAKLIAHAKMIDWNDVEKANNIGISAGASAPEILVDEVVAAIKNRHQASIEEVMVTQEDIIFKLPALLQD
jgi:4-hydroxy-3-methylbut-2-enyl diphosphate reductase